MPRSTDVTRTRILDAAYGLFWRAGFERASVDEIAARAKVTKRTLYYHFRSKDDLLAAVLEQSSALALERLRRISGRLPANRDATIDAVFAQLTEWTGKPRWSGPGFTRLVMELADLPGHPARAIARRHKAMVEAWLADLLAEGKVPAPQDRAREVMLVMEGAMALILIHGDRGYGSVAAEAAKRLVAGEANKRAGKRTRARANG